MKRRLFILLTLIISTVMVISQDNYVVTTGPLSSVYVRNSIDLVKSMYESIGMDVEVQAMPYEKAIIKSSSGVSDAELFRVLSIVDKYPDLIPMNQPLITVEQVAFSLEPCDHLKHIEDLKDVKLAYVRGIKIIEKATEGYNRVETDNIDKAFLLLLHGRVDYVIISSLTGKEYLEKNSITGVYHSEALLEQNVYHFVHRKNIHLLPKLEKALSEIKDNYPSHNKF